jgi:hypothetical protein
MCIMVSESICVVQVRLRKHCMIQVLREIFFRAYVLGSKELNRGHVAQKSKITQFL